MAVRLHADTPVIHAEQLLIYRVLGLLRHRRRTTATARRLHLSVRAVTYRLERVATLTGYDPTDPAQRFTVHAAVLGARLLGWPQHHLTPPP